MGKKEKRSYDEVEDEQERAERKEKKRLQKEADKVAKMLGYSNEINPFGDSNLLKPFIWGKKEEKLKKEPGGRRHEESAEEKQIKLMMEIDRARKRREDKEREQEEMERLRAEEQRLRESEQHGDWERKEEAFHTEQTRVRSTIRLLEHRELPIDRIAKNVLLLEAASSTEREDKLLAMSLARVRDVQLQDPLDVIHEVSSSEFSTLITEIDSYIELATLKKSEYLDFWRWLKEAALSDRRMRDHRKQNKALHKAVVTDVRNLLKGKSSAELLEMEEDIRRSIKAGERVDVEYWEQVSDEVRAQRYGMLVRECHASMLAKRTEAIEKLKELELVHQQEQQQQLGVGQGEGQYEASSGSTVNDFKLMKLSHDYSTQSNKQQDLQSSEIAFLREEQAKGLEEMEETMGTKDELSLKRGTYKWEDKYRPRKPSYFNRVKTGFDWNLYNQTHYDKENPPPKTVQGYKFNIFFPDLIDITKAPTYFLEGADEQEYAIIRFHSGPPYEDLAFKIVNREWDTDRRNGFRCTFERGILQLHFNFKRYRYKR